MMLLMLVGCADEVSIMPDQGGCEEDVGEAVVAWELVGERVRVWRTNIELPQSGLTFSPVFYDDGRVLSAHEFWTDPETDDPFCYSAELLLDGVVRPLEVRWFLADDVTPFATVVLDLE